MTFPEANTFLGQTGPLANTIFDNCATLEKPPSGFERIWSAFEPMDIMQKRGQIVRPQTGEAWQFLCDEGAGLGGTDWAPPPLAYFGAGMASSITAAIVEKAATQNIPADAVSVALDNQYSLSGSILRGTMEGKGLNPDVAVSIDTDVLSRDEKYGLVLEAISTGLAGYLLKNIFISEFSLIANREPVALELPHWENNLDATTLPTTALKAATDTAYVTKSFIRAKDSNFNAGSGSGLDTVQNRALTVSSETISSTNGIFTLAAGIARPDASVYKILGSSDTGTVGAASSAVLLAAGIGFCYMTQLGRYAEAKKRPVKDYRMIQAIDLPLPGSDGNQTPVVGTKLFLNQEKLDTSFAQDVAHSAKRTCFLHSTLQSSLRSKITVT